MMPSRAFWAALVAATAIALPAHAQRTPAYQDGTLAANDVLKGIASGRYSKAGGLTGDSNGLGVNPFSITTLNGPGLQFNSAATTGSYNYFSFGHNASGDPVTIVNGVSYSLPGGATGVVGPSPTVVDNITLWNASNGTLLKDGGTTTGRIGGLALAGASSGATTLVSAAAASGTVTVPSLTGSLVVGPGSSTVGRLALFNNTGGTLLADSGWLYDSNRLTGPNDATLTLQGLGAFQVGGSGGPYVTNDTALDTVTVIAQVGALPSGDTTNLQVHAPATDGGALLNLTKAAVLSPAREERMIVGYSTSIPGEYLVSQVVTGAGTCRDIRFSNGTDPAFWVSCGTLFTLPNAAGISAYRSGNVDPQNILQLNADDTLDLGLGEDITKIIARKPLLATHATSATLSSCGTSPTISGNATAGQVTVGTGTITACTVTFGITYSSIPKAVVVTGIGTGSTVLSLSAKSETAFTVASSADMATQAFNYIVIQ